MAIHHLVPQIEVEVIVDGRPLREYHGENDPVTQLDPQIKLHLENWTVTKYVEATTGKNFSIKMRVYKGLFCPAPQLSFWLYLDGCLVHKYVATRDQLENGWVVEDHGVSDVFQGHEMFSKYKFSGIEIESAETNDADPEKTARDKITMSDVGNVVVKVFKEGPKYRVRNQKVGPKQDTMRSWQRLPDRVREEAVKEDNKSNGISLNFPEILPLANPNEPEWRNTSSPLDDIRPMVKFHFKYRTLEQLEDLHVIKRASEQLHHYIRPEEQEPVENFIQNLRREVRTQSDGPDGTVCGDDPAIKKEEKQEGLNILGRAPRFREKQKPYSENDILDLTGDDD